MAKDPIDSVRSQKDREQVFRDDILSEVEKSEWPGRIDYVASRINDGNYIIGPQSLNSDLLLDGHDLEQVAREFYLEGIAALTGETSRRGALPRSFRVGDLLVEFEGLREGLGNVDRGDVPPGEIISRLVTRSIQRQARGSDAEVARQLRADAETPREFVTELTRAPEVASLVDSALPETDDPGSLTTKLASLDLTTELWNHQLESLALWLHHDTNAYVDMATATGKTVLGLAAVAHAVDSGSLHPADQDRLDDVFDGDVPDLSRTRPNDVLIVTTDDLLGVQWARLFQEHCHTPPSFTTVGETGIQLPWGKIEIRSARGLSDVDPSNYRLAIFDEVHNYSARSGWGDHLVDFIESECPVLALTGSVTEQLETLVEKANQPFPLVYRYTHGLALADGVIPDFEWTLTFTEVAETDTLGKFRDTAELFDNMVRYDSGIFSIWEGSLEEHVTDLTPSQRKTIRGDYASGAAVAKAIRSAGEDGSAPTESLESLASGISNRTIHRLNLSPDLESINSIADDAVSNGRPLLVLTRSYEESQRIAEDLTDIYDDVLVEYLDPAGSAEEHDAKIQSFDDADTGRKVLIGPGKRIGQGNDIQSVEVGINIARPGSGVNATLVQRLGRLLRNANGKDTVQFYHVIGVPPAEATIGPDGESFVTTVSEFFSQVLEPDTDGILKPPSVKVAEKVRSDISKLERLGLPSIRDPSQATVIESAYATAIEERSDDDVPVVDSDWFSTTLEDETKEAHKKTTYDGRVDTPGTDDPSGETSSDRDPDRDEGVENDPEFHGHVSPLAEYYDGLRSLAIIQKSLIESVSFESSDSKVFRLWVDDVQSILTEEGYSNQKVGYGKQQAERSPIKIGEYRERFGTGGRVTEYENLSVQPTPQTIVTLLDESFSELSSWVVPVAPESEEPLPVLVETEAELQQARSLLEEFPSEPELFQSGEMK